MKILIIGAGPLGSLYACRLYRAGKDVTLLARNEHYRYLKENGVVMIDEFTGERTKTHLNLTDNFEQDEFDLVIVVMRKNRVLQLLPELAGHDNLRNFLFLGNNALGFDEYLKYLPAKRVLFGFPGGGGSRIEHIVHFVDAEKPGGARMPLVIGEVDGKTTFRARQIAGLFKSSGIPVKIVDDMDSWLKYHVAFVLPLAGAILKSGDNYALAKNKPILRQYIYAVREAGRVLKSIGYHKSYNFKFRLFYWLPAGLLVRVLSRVFNTKFSEVAMMMHIRAARDEMITLVHEFRLLQDQSSISTPNLDELMATIDSPQTVKKAELEMAVPA